MERFSDPIEPHDLWESAEASPELHARLEAARAYSEAHGGRSLLLLEGERMLFEAYYNGHQPSTSWPIWSATKTLSCMLATLGVAQGRFTLDEHVSDTLSTWRETPHKRSIRVEHLLRLTSGLKTSNWWLTMDGIRPLDRQFVEDKYAYALDRPTSHHPWTHWEYGSVHHAVFGAFVEQKLGESPLAWLQRDVFDPIDFRMSGWHHDRDGNPMMAFGAWSSTRELAKLGMLLRDDGVWGEERVLPEGTLATCMKPTTINPAYGLAVWLNEPIGPNIPFRAGGLNDPEDGEAILVDGPKMLVAAGALGQRLIVIPSLDWVLVHQGNSNRLRTSTFMNLLFHGVEDP